MAHNERQQRIEQELQTIAKLVQHSTILTIKTTVEAPDRLTLNLRGNGVVKTTASHALPELQTEHAIELRLPLNFPQSPPDIRWLTPIWHPNISYSGFVNLADVSGT
jgi:ubiquitin-protein ligase